MKTRKGTLKSPEKQSEHEVLISLKDMLDNEDWK